MGALPHFQAKPHTTDDGGAASSLSASPASRAAIQAWSLQTTTGEKKVPRIHLWWLTQCSVHGFDLVIASGTFWTREASLQQEESWSKWDLHPPWQMTYSANCISSTNSWFPEYLGQTFRGFPTYFQHDEFIVTQLHMSLWAVGPWDLQSCHNSLKDPAGAAGRPADFSRFRSSVLCSLRQRSSSRPETSYGSNIQNMFVLHIYIYI